MEDFSSCYPGKPGPSLVTLAGPFRVGGQAPPPGSYIPDLKRLVQTTAGTQFSVVSSRLRDEDLGLHDLPHEQVPPTSQPDRKSSYYYYY